MGYRKNAIPLIFGSTGHRFLISGSITLGLYRCVLFDVSQASPLNSRCEGAWQARLAH